MHLICARAEGPLHPLCVFVGDPDGAPPCHSYRPAALAPSAAVHNFLPSRARPPERCRWGAVFRRALDQPEAEVLSGGPFLTFPAAAIGEAVERAPWST